MDEISKKESEDLKILRKKMIRAMKKCFIFALFCALLVSVIATMFVQNRMLSMLLFPWITFIFSFVISCIICSWKIAGFHSEYVFASNDRDPFEGINRSIEYYAFVARNDDLYRKNNS